MNIELYATNVTKLINLLNHNVNVNPEFIDQAFEDGLTTVEAVTSWFSDEEIKFDVTHHLGNTDFKLVDVYINGLGSIKRVVFNTEITKGDLFNVYYCESSKGGAIFTKDIITTLKLFKAEHLDS